MKKSFWSMPCKDEHLGVYTVTHEYGHIIQNVLIEEGMKERGWTWEKRHDFVDFKKKSDKAKLKWYTKTREEIQKEHFKEIVRLAKEIDEDYNLDKYLSRYGSTSYAEFFAETFANSKLGEPNVLGKAMQIWIEKKWGNIK